MFARCTADQLSIALVHCTTHSVTHSLLMPSSSYFRD